MHLSEVVVCKLAPCSCVLFREHRSVARFLGIQAGGRSFLKKQLAFSLKRCEGCFVHRVRSGMAKNHAGLDGLE